MGSQFNIGNGAVGITGLLISTPGSGGGAPPGTGGGGGGGAAGIAGGGGAGGAGTLGEGGGRGAELSTSFGITMFSEFSLVISDLMSSSFCCIAS